MNPAAYREFLQVIRYVLKMKKLGLKFEPAGNAKKPWEIVCFGNSDYDGDLMSRSGISGSMKYVMGVPISWQSKSQNSVSLSSTETEYLALSDAVKEVMLIIQLLGSMKIYV